MLGAAAGVGLTTYAVVEDLITRLPLYLSLAKAGFGGGGWGRAARVNMPNKYMDALGDMKGKVDRFEDVKVKS